MFRVYRWFYEVVGFSRSQTHAFLILLPLMAFLVFWNPLYRLWRAEPPRDFSADIRLLDSLLATWPEGKAEQSMVAEPPPQPIDPNSAPVAALKAAGLPISIANRVMAYREKGGKFKAKPDMLKIYGMDSALYAKVYPLLLLPDAPAPKRKIEFARREEKPKADLYFDLNAADTVMLKKVNGIGTKLSKRIIRYREALGGFVSVEQLHEVYRLDSAVIIRLKKIAYIDPDFRPRKINLNTAGRSELTVHPYLSHKAAGVIVAYRFQHGKFSSIEDLGKITPLDSVSIRKLKPYLEI